MHSSNWDNSTSMTESAGRLFGARGILWRFTTVVRYSIFPLLYSTNTSYDSVVVLLLQSEALQSRRQDCTVLYFYLFKKVR